MEFPHWFRLCKITTLSFFVEKFWRSTQDDGSEESEEGSEFEGDSDVFDESSGSDEDSESACQCIPLGSDYVCWFIVVEGDSDSASAESLSDEGEDWDELERKAKRGKCRFDTVIDVGA